MKPIQLLFILIPERLKGVAHWVGWKQEIRNTELTKVPYNVRTLRMAKVNEPATWSTYDAALDVAQRGLVAGIGYVVTKEDYLTFIDFDNCRDSETGTISDEAQHWVERFNTYAEVSQSGEGIHIYVAGNVPHCHNLKPYEIYDERRFFVVTGQHLTDTPKTIEQRQDVLDEFYAEKFAHKDAEQPDQLVRHGDVISDEAVIEKACKAKNGAKFMRLFYRGDTTDYAGDDSRADMALCALLAFWCENDDTQIDRIFRTSAIFRPAKWDRKTGDTTYGALTIKNAQSAETYAEHVTEANDRACVGANSPDIRARALDILKNGDPMAFLTKTFETLHKGDVVICEGMMLAEAVKSVLNALGIQTKLTGLQGKGKTHAARASLFLTPQDRVLYVSMSDKAIWYYPQVQTGCTIFSDDTSISPEMEGTVKRVTSNWQRENERVVVQGKNRKESELQRIPARIHFVFTSVHTQGSTELVDRQMGYDVDESQDAEYIEFELERAGKVQLEVPETDDVLVCREMFNILQNDDDRNLRLTGVEIPFSKRILWNDTENRRNLNIFLDMIRAYATFSAKQREVNEDGNIVATEADFNAARKHYGSRAKLQKYHLTKNAALLVQYMQGESKATIEASAIDSKEIQNHFKKSKSWVTPLIHELSKALYNFHVVNQYRTETEATDSGVRTGRPRDLYYIEGGVVLNLEAFDSVAALKDDA